MKIKPVLLIISLISLLTSCSTKSEFTVKSPDANLTVALKYHKEEGILTYTVQSNGLTIIEESKVGIRTNLSDFTDGLVLRKYSSRTIDETYSLPQGKVSQYRNHANEQRLNFVKDKHEYNVIFRVYNDGVGFRFEIPGNEEIEIYEENTNIRLAGDSCTFWGQNHPNRYGYESALGPVDGELISAPVLAHLAEKNHFVLMGQAATYGNYIQPHFKRVKSSFSYQFPLDQENLGPVKTRLPFESPWRMLIISPDDPGMIVESYLMENLNPSTRKEFLLPDGTFKDWILPGNVMWDYIAKDGDKPRMWIDAAAEMGWKYYMADAGFAKRWGGADSVKNIMDYANHKNISVIGWAHTREFDTYEKASETISRYAGWGLKGAKIDFFDHNTLSDNPRNWRDYEDTQTSLQMRDWIFELGMKNSFLLELHGNTLPTGERRQFPNLMTLEGVDGMERRSKPAANESPWHSTWTTTVSPTTTGEDAMPMSLPALGKSNPSPRYQSRFPSRSRQARSFDE